MFKNSAVLKHLEIYCTAINRHYFYLKEIRCDSVGWIQLAHDVVQWLVLVNTVMKLLFP